MQNDHANSRFSAATRTIVVEARKDPQPARMLDALADGCALLGFQVIRWRGPLSGRLPYSRWLPPCDAAILFNGSHPAYQPTLSRLQSLGAATLFVELGWYPQASHYQVDTQGVNAAASWCQELLQSSDESPLCVRESGDLLALLQLNNDTQITIYSPWFATMANFVQHLAAHSALPVRVRPHPLDRANTTLRQLVRDLGCAWDDSPNLADSFQQAKAVACVNSSAAVEAMTHELPVLCYGRAVYRQPAAVYCLTIAPEETQVVTRQLQAGHCILSPAAMRAMVQRIQAHQWKPEEVRERLPPLLQSLSWPTKSPGEASSSLQTAYHWFRDLPARILYRHRWRTTPTTSK